MTQQERRKGGGSKLSRSETVTVRLDQKLRYLAELGARKHRRTLSSFIEWAVEDTLGRVVLYESESNTRSLADEATELWDVDECDRFARLALIHPDLLTHDEQVLWKLIRETGHLWLGHYDDEDHWTWNVRKESLIYERLRQLWDDLRSVAKGEKARDTLPTVGPNTSPPPIEDDAFAEEDIPL